MNEETQAEAEIQADFQAYQRVLLAARRTMLWACTLEPPEGAYWTAGALVACTRDQLSMDGHADRDIGPAVVWAFDSLSFDAFIYTALDGSVFPGPEFPAGSELPRRHRVRAIGHAEGIQAQLAWVDEQNELRLNACQSGTAAEADV